MVDKLDMETAYNKDRDRGILTPDDRKFLWGQKEYEHPTSARNRRAKIRQRVKNAILDFNFLKHLEMRDCKQIVNTDDSGVPSGLSSAHILLYSLLIHSVDDEEIADMNLELFIEQAVQIVDQNRGYRSEVNIEINREELQDPIEIFKRAKKEGILTLTGPEMDLLWISDEIDPASLASFLNKRFSEHVRPSHIQKEREGLQKYLSEEY